MPDSTTAPAGRSPEALALALHLLGEHGQTDAYELEDPSLQMRHALVHADGGDEEAG
jgi:hypothetical protein